MSRYAKDLDDRVLRMSILKISRILSITNAEAVERFLKKDDLGRNRFIIEDGSMIRYFMDIERVPHERVWLTANPFIDTEYFTERKKRLDMIKHVIRSPDHWSASKGRCAVCGLCIFYYQGRHIAEDIDGTKAYVHDACWEDTFILRDRKRFRFHPSGQSPIRDSPKAYNSEYVDSEASVVGYKVSDVSDIDKLSSGVNS